jgi:hypothetical protein
MTKSIKMQGTSFAPALSSELTPIDDDPYYTEVSTFIDAVESGTQDSILSNYKDSAKTYELTWAIRIAAEASSKARRERLAARKA